MTEITRKYRDIAESNVDETDGVVERALEELNEFIEHRTTQKILLEACEYDQAQRGIRVGPQTTA